MEIFISMNLGTLFMLRGFVITMIFNKIIYYDFCMSRIHLFKMVIYIKSLELPLN